MNTHHLLLTTYAIAMLLIAGCKKPDPPQTDGPEKLCRIELLKNENPPGTYGNGYLVDFEYDTNGNPTRIHQLNGGVYLNDYLFKYDSLNRVSDIILYYYHTHNVIGEYFTRWYRPIYDAKNRIIKDSIYSGGTIGEDPIPEEFGYGVRGTAYTYDAQNRIVKSVESYVDFGMTYFIETKYFYNPRSNNLDSLIQWSSNNSHRYGAIYSEYDNKINIRRTNPIWQYLDRNYSRNNNFNTTEYNEYNLPTKAIPNDSISSVPFLSFNLSLSTITYACQQPGKNL